MLLNGDFKFHWVPEQAEALNSLKRALMSDPLLALYREDAPTALHTDVIA